MQCCPLLECALCHVHMPLPTPVMDIVPNKVSLSLSLPHTYTYPTGTRTCPYPHRQGWEVRGGWGGGGARTLGLRKTVSMCLFPTCTTVGVTFIFGHLFPEHVTPRPRTLGYAFRYRGKASRRANNLQSREEGGRESERESGDGGREGGREGGGKEGGARERETDQ